MASNIEEIANRLNLDKSTVSRALNGKPGRMSEATRRRILDEAARLGYVPNPLARALSHGQTGSIGFVSRPFSDDLYTAVFQAVAIAVDEAETHLVTCITGRDTSRHGQTALLHPGRVDGLLAIPDTLPGLDSKDSPWRSVPLVLLLPSRPLPDVPSVSFDDADGIFKVAEHLWQLGHRWILYLQGIGEGGRPLDSGRRRFAGLRAAWRGFGADPDQYIAEVPGPTVSAGGFHAVQEAHRRGTPFTAVVAYNDQMAHGATAALYGAGLLIPEEVSVVGWNDLDDENDFTYPPLTSVRVSPRDLATNALTVLNQQIAPVTTEAPTKQKRPAAEQIALPVQLVIRSSTATAPAPTRRGRKKGS